MSADAAFDSLPKVGAQTCSNCGSLVATTEPGRGDVAGTGVASVKLCGNALRNVLLRYRDSERVPCSPEDVGTLRLCAAAYANLCMEPFHKIYNAFKPSSWDALPNGAVFCHALPALALALYEMDVPFVVVSLLVLFACVVTAIAVRSWSFECWVVRAPYKVLQPDQFRAALRALHEVRGLIQDREHDHAEARVTKLLGDLDAAIAPPKALPMKRALELVALGRRAEKERGAVQL